MCMPGFVIVLDSLATTDLTSDLVDRNLIYMYIYLSFFYTTHGHVYIL